MVSGTVGWNAAETTLCLIERMVSAMRVAISIKLPMREGEEVGAALDAWPLVWVPQSIWRKQRGRIKTLARSVGLTVRTTLRYYAPGCVRVEFSRTKDERQAEPDLQTDD